MTSTTSGLSAPTLRPRTRPGCLRWPTGRPSGTRRSPGCPGCQRAGRSSSGDDSDVSVHPFRSFRPPVTDGRSGLASQRSTPWSHLLGCGRRIMGHDTAGCCWGRRGSPSARSGSDGLVSSSSQRSRAGPVSPGAPVGVRGGRDPVVRGEAGGSAATGGAAGQPEPTAGRRRGGGAWTGCSGHGDHAVSDELQIATGSSHAGHAPPMPTRRMTGLPRLVGR